jgi:hypothetical protein
VQQRISPLQFFTVITSFKQQGQLQGFSRVAAKGDQS